MGMNYGVRMMTSGRSRHFASINRIRLLERKSQPGVTLTFSQPALRAVLSARCARSA